MDAIGENDALTKINKIIQSIKIKENEINNGQSNNEKKVGDEESESTFTNDA